MFYKIKLEDYISLEPEKFENNLEESIKDKIMEQYKEYNSEDIGLVITVLEINKIGQGFKLPEDSSRFYLVEFTVISYKPELHEVVEGEISSVTNFGVFINIGIIDGLIHLSQIMPEQVSFSKTGVVQGSTSGRSLKAGMMARAAIVAISFKDIRNIKLGLTMRQPGLGALSWLEEEQTKKEA